ncbi:ethylene-responsive transcription factor ABR1-like isoform X1 [Tripterygium wilfordii]|uniref:Ethylene-responsive transcription factor ABR1-like isoform X1 n=1 Tax=Tripterygium wilfordii TaxID=458696 RepID=A0A7J7CML7_TRIWF|nr:ethylene-responsive transcription factor ABR1-like isoform X1 [Tripterygium wilfordii]
MPQQQQTISTTQSTQFTQQQLTSPNVTLPPFFQSQPFQVAPDAMRDYWDYSQLLQSSAGFPLHQPSTLLEQMYYNSQLASMQSAMPPSSSGSSSSASFPLLFSTQQQQPSSFLRPPPPQQHQQQQQSEVFPVPPWSHSGRSEFIDILGIVDAIIRTSINYIQFDGIVRSKNKEMRRCTSLLMTKFWSSTMNLETIL